MNNDLIARYIYAVTSQLPYKMRDEVQKELDSLIADMLLERCGDIVPIDKDIKIILMELGSPDELAFEYSGEERRALISGPYFLTYKRALKIALFITIPTFILLNILTFFTKGNFQISGYELFVKMLNLIVTGIISGAIHVFAGATFLFAVLERKKVALSDLDAKLSSLPPVPAKAARIKLFEPIFAISWSFIMALLFLNFPQVAGVWNKETGWISLFVIPVLRSFWIFIILWAVLGIAKEIMKCIEGQYTIRLAVVTFVCNIAIAICAVIIFMNDKIMNPEFISRISEIFASSDKIANIPVSIFANFNLFLVCGVLFALVLEMVVTTVKALKYKQ